MEYPRAGGHYPRSTGEFLAWFSTDEDCLDYLEWLRWPGGFTCPWCGHAGGWRLGDGRRECGGCGRRTSVTAGTVFDRMHTPLTVWFHACWLFATAKDGISAQYLQRTLEIGSYATAWGMLHRLRSVLVRPGRGRLSGNVEVDETFIGGEETGLRGGRRRGKKVLTGIAVEVREPKGIGRCRMAVLADASAESLHPFITGAVEPGARVITDGWTGYIGLDGLGYAHERRSQRAARARGEDPGGTAACGTPRRLAGQAVAAGHPPGIRRGGALARLPQRIRLPVQPPQLAQPRHALLPRDGTGRRARADPVRRYPHQQKAPRQGTGHPWQRPPAQSAAPGSEPALAHDRDATPASTPVNPVNSRRFGLAQRA